MTRSYQSTVVSLVALIAVGLTSVSFADGKGDEEGQRYRRHEDRDPFSLGVCVGQDLAQQGLSIAAPSPGEGAPTLDSTTQAALQTAIQSCRAEMSGASPSPSTSAAPSSTPSIEPSTEPSPTESSSG